MMISLPTYSITPNELNIKSEVESICKSLNTPCEVEYITSYIPQGYATYDNKIILSSGLMSVLSYEELRAVSLHEVGHIVLKHYKQVDKFMKHWDLNPTTLKQLRHKHELEADTFAVQYDLITNHQNYLAPALQHLVSPQQYIQETNSHPSPNYRVNIINSQIKRNYKNVIRR